MIGGQRSQAKYTISGRRLRRRNVPMFTRSRGDRHIGLNIGNLHRRRARNKVAASTRRAQRKTRK